MSNVLVTGGAGFIGGHLHKTLLDQGYTVIIVDDFSTGKEENIDRRVKDVIISTAGDTPTSILKSIDTVFHFGEMAGELISYHLPDVFYWKNLSSSYKLIKKCIQLGTKNFLYSSSIAVYGYKKRPPISEQAIPNPDDPYGSAKLQIENLLTYYGIGEALNWKSVRLFNVYGPKMNLEDPYRNVTSIFINQALNNRPLTVFGKGVQKRAYTFIDDILVPLIRLGIEIPVSSSPVNLGSEHPVSVNALSREILGAFELDLEIRHVNGMRGEKSIFCSVEKAKRLVNYKPRFTLKLGIGKTVNWAKSLKVKPSFNYDLYGSNFMLRQRMPVTWERNG